MKRVITIEKCRKCRGEKWEKHETVTNVSTIHDRLKHWWLSENAPIHVKTWYVCANCKTKMFHDPLTIVLVPEYNEFQQEEYGMRLKVKPQRFGDTELIKWSQKHDGYEMRDYNSYTLVLDEKGPWTDAHGNKVQCYSINGCGEVRWEMTYGNSVDEASIVKKFKLTWTSDQEKPYWLKMAEQNEAIADENERVYNENHDK